MQMSNSQWVGHGDTENRMEPQIVEGIRPYIDVVGLSTGYSHTALVSQAGEVFVFGASHKGQLGTGSSGDVLTPIPLKLNEPVKMVNRN